MHLGTGVLRVYGQSRPGTFERTCVVFKRQLRISQIVVRVGVFGQAFYRLQLHRQGVLQLAAVMQHRPQDLPAQWVVRVVVHEQAGRDLGRQVVTTLVGGQQSVLALVWRLTQCLGQLLDGVRRQIELLALLQVGMRRIDITGLLQGADQPRPVLGQGRLGLQNSLQMGNSQLRLGRLEEKRSETAVGHRVRRQSLEDLLVQLAGNRKPAHAPMLLGLVQGVLKNCGRHQ